MVAHSAPEDAVSFNQFHILHHGIWRYHLLEEIKIILGKLPQKYAAQLESQ